MLDANSQLASVMLIIKIILYFAPGEVHNIVMSLFVCFCLFVCLSACIIRKPNGRTLPNFCACCLWPWLGHPLTALQYVMYFRFCGWRHIFMPWGQLARIKHNVMFRRSSPSGSSSWTSDTYSVWLSSSECGTGGEVCCLRLLYSFHVITFRCHAAWPAPGSSVPSNRVFFWADKWFSDRRNTPRFYFIISAKWTQWTAEILWCLIPSVRRSVTSL